MKNSLQAISLLLAASIPGTILAESLGARLPVALDTEHVFGAFVVAVTLLTVLTDYTRSTKPLTIPAPLPTAHIAQFPSSHAAERLAA